MTASWGLLQTGSAGPPVAAADRQRERQEAAANQAEFSPALHSKSGVINRQCAPVLPRAHRCCALVQLLDDVERVGGLADSTMLPARCCNLNAVRWAAALE